MLYPQLTKYVLAVAPPRSAVLFPLPHPPTDCTSPQPPLYAARMTDAAAAAPSPSPTSTFATRPILDAQAQIQVLRTRDDASNTTAQFASRAIVPFFFYDFFLF